MGSSGTVRSQVRGIFPRDLQQRRYSIYKYIITSPPHNRELRESEGNPRSSPRVGLDVIVMVTVVELVCVDDVGVTSAFRVVAEAGVRL